MKRTGRHKQEIHTLVWHSVNACIVCADCPYPDRYFLKEGVRGQGSGERGKIRPETVSRRAGYPVENPRKFELRLLVLLAFSTSKSPDDCVKGILTDPS